MRFRLLVVGMVLSAATPLFAQDLRKGQVTMPLSEVERIIEEIEHGATPEVPPIPICRIERSIRGAFRKGLFKGTLEERFEVLETRGHVRVPILDSQVSIGQVRLNNKHTSLLKEGEMYTVGVEKPGTYTISLSFYLGEDRHRFARRLLFGLPDGGATTLYVEIPETDLDARLSGGVLTGTYEKDNSTVVEGRLPPSGGVDFSWSRRATHRGAAAAKMDAAIHTLFSVEEAAIKGVSSVSYAISEGEIDMVTLALPQGIEVVKVTGDAVLQWATESEAGGRLNVLLRYLVSDKLEMSIDFQAPMEASDLTSLRMPVPLAGTPFTGVAGVYAPSGMDLQIVKMEKAVEVSSHDLPAELLDMTKNPLRFGFSFSEIPMVDAKVTRNAQVSLTSTVIEEIQASTVLVEDGLEITKMKLRVRNNTREYLQAVLPKNAVLTHSLIEGRTVRPAAMPGDETAILFPLQKSERIKEGEARRHTVRPGETLSDIANFYFSNPADWGTILAANPEKHSPVISAGEQLVIPSKPGGHVEESSFIIELAYKSKASRLGRFGNRRISLPKLDVDAMRVVWHVYLPESLEPLRFTSNLVQHSNIRYDPFRRMMYFIQNAMWIRHAWAGGGYKSILSSRKAIYRNEIQAQTGREEVRTAFPFVGDRYKFKHILLGKETPTVSVDYVLRDLYTAAQIAAFIIGLGLMGLMINRFSNRPLFIGTALLLIGLILVSHYIIGMRRRLLWGADMAIIISILRLQAGPILERVKEILNAPWLAVRLITFKNLLWLIGALAILTVMLRFPLFVSSVLFLVLLLLRRRAGALKEVPDVR